MQKLCKYIIFMYYLIYIYIYKILCYLILMVWIKGSFSHR